MKRIVIIIYLLAAFSFTKAQQQNYDAGLIPKELLPYASAVVREDEFDVEVESMESTIIHAKMAITILNKNGDHMAGINLTHDKNDVIKSVKGLVYNEFGKVIAKFSEGDFDDKNTWDGFSLFDGTKVKTYSPSITEYPYTIVYEYEKKLKQSLDLPGWISTNSFGVAVEKSIYTLTCKPDFNIRYKVKNMADNVTIGTNSKGLKTYRWEEDKLKAIKYEPFSPYKQNYFRNIAVAPEKFTYYGINGSFTNWKELGKWEYDKLVADRQELPMETIENVKEMTKDIPDPKLKAKKIYEYMQNKTHYISVQIGIGGYQPFLASDVDKQNYGDCKALVNYTQALLKAVNIQSYYCVVEAGRSYKVGLMHDFASMDQGNHIILCLPFKNDTTWADCTSQTFPFGYLGDFTDDRNVLACTPEGGKLLHTPKYTYKDNMESRKANFVIGASGDLSGTMSTIFKGTNYDERDELVNESTTEQNKVLQHIYPINNMEIEKLDLKQDKSFNPVTTENIKLNAAEYASVADDKLYFLLNAANRYINPPPNIVNRSNNVYINRGYTEEDEIVYTLPAGYKSEKMPLNVNLNKPFGRFTATMQINGSQIIYKRKLELIDGTYDKDKYNDLVDFYEDIANADSYSVTLTKKGA